MRRKRYQDSAHLLDRLAPDWRWRRAGWVASGDPAADRYADDNITLLAVRVQAGESGPELSDVRTAWAVYQAGGLVRRTLQSYLLTDLSAADIGGLAGLSEAVVDAYADLFYAVRGNDRVSVHARLVAEASADPLVRAARFGPLAVEVRAAMEVGEVPPEWEGVAERMELAELMRQLEENPVAYIRAVARLRRVEGG